MTTPTDHYYLNAQGLLVMTAKHHRARGYCCGNACMHCPYDYANVPEGKRERMLTARNQRWAKEGKSAHDE